MDRAPADDEGMDRALERTLVREGGLVLAPNTYEFSPQFSYAHWDKIQDPDIRNSYAAAMSFRVGLPWQTQLSLSLPYVHNEARAGPSSSGLADAGVLVSKELLRESDWVPNLVGSVGWTSPTSHGNTFGPIPYVSGFQAGFTASKRLDPLVVFMTGSYYSSLSHEIAGTKINPSDVVGFRMGTSLAISPATALTAAMNFNYLVDPHAGDLVVLTVIWTKSRRVPRPITTGTPSAAAWGFLLTRSCPPAKVQVTTTYTPAFNAEPT
jgi:hypothetical protein